MLPEHSLTDGTDHCDALAAFLCKPRLALTSQHGVEMTSVEVKSILLIVLFGVLLISLYVTKTKTFAGDR
jgi:hypothetical protein